LLDVLELLLVSHSQSSGWWSLRLAGRRDRSHTRRVGVVPREVASVLEHFGIHDVGRQRRRRREILHRGKASVIPSRLVGRRCIRFFFFFFFFRCLVPRVFRRRCFGRGRLGGCVLRRRRHFVGRRDLRGHIIG